MCDVPQTTDLEVYLIPDKSIHLFKEFVTERLRTLSFKTSEEIDFITLSEYCTNGATSLFLICDKATDKPLGHFACTPIIENGKTELYLSAACAVKGSPVSVLIAGLQKAEKFAIMVAADVITFSSPRKGWLHTAKKLGFSFAGFSNNNYHFTKDLPDGSKTQKG